MVIELKDKVGILVFTTQEVLDHKLRDGLRSEGDYCFWETSKYPKQFEENPDAEWRLYFAIKGQVKGYFIIHDNYDNLQFFSESWKPIKDGEILRPSQGWRYYLHKEEK